MEVEESDSYTVECSVYGHVEPAVTWQLDERDMVEVPGRRAVENVFSDSTTVSTLSVSSADAG